MRPSSLFRNRWNAVFWAAGICWTAYTMQPSQSDAPKNDSDATMTVDATGTAVSQADLQALANAMPGN